jgi:hypothetical protein
MEKRMIEDENSEQRNYVKPAWQPTEEQLAQEKQIILNEPTPEPTTQPESTTESEK